MVCLGQSQQAFLPHCCNTYLRPNLEAKKHCEKPDSQGKPPLLAPLKTPATRRPHFRGKSQYKVNPRASVTRRFRISPVCRS